MAWSNVKTTETTAAATTATTTTTESTIDNNGDRRHARARSFRSFPQYDDNQVNIFPVRYIYI